MNQMSGLFVEPGNLDGDMPYRVLGAIGHDADEWKKKLKQLKKNKETISVYLEFAAMKTTYQFSKVLMIR